jgi:hypothetical protein
MKRGVWILLCILMAASLSAQILPNGQSNSEGDSNYGYRYFPQKTTFNYPFVTDYIVVFGDYKDLPKLVMEKIKAGWKLYGTPFGRTGSDWVYQALVKLQ